MPYIQLLPHPFLAPKKNTHTQTFSPPKQRRSSSRHSSLRLSLERAVRDTTTVTELFLLINGKWLVI